MQFNALQWTRASHTKRQKTQGNKHAKSQGNQTQKLIPQNHETPRTEYWSTHIWVSPFKPAAELQREIAEDLEWGESRKSEFEDLLEPKITVKGGKRARKGQDSSTWEREDLPLLLPSAPGQKASNTYQHWWKPFRLCTFTCSGFRVIPGNKSNKTSIIDHSESVIAIIWLS